MIEAAAKRMAPKQRDCDRPAHLAIVTLIGRVYRVADQRTAGAI
jgi:hypothetical protein